MITTSRVPFIFSITFISKLYDNETLYDIGTNNGCSAIALSENNSNVVNINFGQVSIREDKDIKSLADEIIDRIERRNQLLSYGIA